MAKKKKSGASFLIQGSVLAVASILVRLIGLVYRIPMTNVLGNEGIVYYSSAYKIYSIILLITSYSMPLAISKLISSRIGKKEYRNVRKILMGGLLFALVVGGLSSSVVFFGADLLASKILNLPQAAIPLRVLAPAIFIMGFLGVFRGFFQGYGNMVPTALSQIFEQIINAVVSVGGAYFLFNLGWKTDLVKSTTMYSASLGASGGTLGTTLGALTALLFCLLMYFSVRPRFMRKVRRDKNHEDEAFGSVMKALIVTILPVLISSTAYNLLDIVDQSVFSYYMQARYTKEEYTMIWSAYDNMYILMLHVPVALSSAMASSCVPAISRSMAEGKTEDIRKKVRGAIRVTLLVAIPSAVGLGVLATPIMRALFSGTPYHDEAALYLMGGCIAVVFFSLATVTNGILQGLGKIAIPVRNAFISLAVHLVVMGVALWVFDMKIFGVIAAYVVFGVVMSTLNLIYIEDMLDMDQDWLKSYIRPGISSAVMGLGVYGAAYLSLHFLHSYKLTLLIGIGLGAVIYTLMLFGLRTFDEQDLLEMPKGGTLVRLSKKLHLIK